MENCLKHQNIDSLMLCMEPECWDVICSDCLYHHIKAKHSKSLNHRNPNLPLAPPNKDVKIKALKSVQGEIVNFLVTVKCLYTKELKRLQNLVLKVNRDHEDNLEKIRNSKEKIIDLIIDVFQRIQENYMTKINLDLINKQCENLVNRMKTGISDIDVFQNCFSDTFNYEKDFPTLELLLKKYGNNELSQEQYSIVTNVHEIASDYRESHIAVDIDESRLFSVGMELSKYVKVVEEAHTPRSNQMLVESEGWFKPEAPKFVHFFEDGTRNLHLFVLDRPFQDHLSPKHDVITLTNEKFLIPNYHRSLVTPNGDIFLTGGNDDQTGRDTTLAYKLDFSQKRLEPIDSMLKARNSHGMAYLEGFLYAVGGNSNEEGCITSCERYEIDGEKKWQKIAKLNVASYGSSLCSFRDKVLYKFGGKRSSWELSNTIEVYSPEQNSWTIVPFQFETHFDRKNFILPCYSAAIQINHNEIVVLGGSDADGNNLVQTFNFSVVEREDTKQKNFLIREVNKRPLLEPECFDMGQIIIYNSVLFCLQNSPIQALGYTTPGGKMAVKKLLAFVDSQWTCIKD